MIPGQLDSQAPQAPRARVQRALQERLGSRDQLDREDFRVRLDHLVGLVNKDRLDGPLQRVLLAQLVQLQRVQRVVRDLQDLLE